jgi:hypothetical protein
MDSDKKPKEETPGGDTLTLLSERIQELEKMVQELKAKRSARESKTP